MPLNMFLLVFTTEFSMGNENSERFCKVISSNRILMLVLDSVKLNYSVF